MAAERSSYLDSYREATSLDGLAAASKASRHSSFDTPMEVGAVSSFDNRRGRPEMSKSAAGRTCHMCNKVGNLKQDCPRNKMAREHKLEGQKKSCNCCGRTNHFYKDCVACVTVRGQPIADKVSKSKKINQIQQHDREEEEEILELLTQSINCMAVKQPASFCQRKAAHTGTCPPQGRRQY